jgi:hypothetical protein
MNNFVDTIYKVFEGHGVFAHEALDRLVWFDLSLMQDIKIPGALSKTPPTTFTSVTGSVRIAFTFLFIWRRFTFGSSCS